MHCGDVTGYITGGAGGAGAAKLVQTETNLSAEVKRSYEAYGATHALCNRLEDILGRLGFSVPSLKEAETEAVPNGEINMLNFANDKQWNNNQRLSILVDRLERALFD